MMYVLKKENAFEDTYVNGLKTAVPKDWMVYPLHVLASIKSGQAPESSLVGSGDLDFHQGNSLFGDTYIKAAIKKISKKAAPKIAEAHSILFSVRAPVGEINLTRYECCIGRGLASLVSKYSTPYLYHVLKTLTPVFKSLSTGTIFEGITAKNLGAVDVKVPPPEEQTAIANILSDQEALVAHHNDLIALHEKRFAYLSDELLSGRLRLQKNALDEAEFFENQQWVGVKLNNDDVSIPHDWAITTLSAYAKISSGQSPESALISDVGIDFHQGNSLFGDKYIKSSEKKIERCLAPKIALANSILFSVRAPVGEVNITSNDMCIGRGLASLTTQNVSEWLYFLLKSMQPVFKQLSTGTTFEGITAKNLGKAAFACPPLEEQTLIANVLSDQEALIAEYKKLRDAEQKRFDWLSDALLSGTYRVKIEP